MNKHLFFLALLAIFSVVWSQTDTTEGSGDETAAATTEASGYETSTATTETSESDVSSTISSDPPCRPPRPSRPSHPPMGPHSGNLPSFENGPPPGHRHPFGNGPSPDNRGFGNGSPFGNSPFRNGGFFNGARFGRERRSAQGEMDGEATNGLQNRLFFGRTVSCNYATQRGFTCSSCSERLFCTRFGGILKRCGGFTPYCNNGFCSFFQSAECAGTTSVAETTTQAATTTNEATTTNQVTTTNQITTTNQATGTT